MPDDPIVLILMEAAARGRELRRQREAQMETRSATILADGADRANDQPAQQAEPVVSGTVSHDCD